MTGGSVVSQEHGMSARFKAILTVIGLLFATTASAAPPPGVTAFVKDHQLARYNIAETDLDGDGHPEALIYAMATTQGANRADLCGSGGCNLYVLALAATRYRLVTAIAITHPPIRVLPAISHGWHDLGVKIAGGGVIPGYEARLRFDGRSYPSNPTILPAVRSAESAGRTVIGADPTK